jgi:hypothetical protein
MPTLPIPPTPAVVVVAAEVPADGPLVPFTCPWAQDGLRKAMEGLQGASSGVKGYKIGTRNVEYQTIADAQKAVDYWNEMVKLYCGVDGLPTSVTGRDTAFRVIPRDV